MTAENNNPWPGPEGMIPVTSGRVDDSNLITRRYLDQILVEMRTIDSTMPDLTTKIFNKLFSTPLMMPAFSHLNKVLKDGRKPMNEYAEVAKELRMLNWVGMESDEDYADIVSCGVPTVRIIKPFEDHDLILKQIEFAQDHGARAVGIDIDHVPGKDGQYDAPDGMPLGPVTFDDLKQYVKFAKIPFVAKGVLSVQDAVKCRNAGCRAIVVSHHHGRMPYAVPPVAMLPAIRRVVNSSMLSNMKIFCDCHIDSGYDAYKALAMGADAVAPGRSILAPLLKAGKEGLKAKLLQMNNELKEMMLYTGIKNTHSFDSSVLHRTEL